MALQGSTIWKLLFRAWTIWNQTIESSQLQCSLLRRLVVEVYCVVLWILFALLLQFLVEELPGESFVVRNDDLVQVRAAYRALFVLQDEPQPQRASDTHVFVTAGTHREEFQLVVAQQAIH